ncbi:MAG TPA: EcsC family protein [Arenimonas sp.]|uniref:EcsC family protein n=1 Tax=Arenimonas sp. TaxID=1872635 RepID=UPI002D800B10|nr:EcsC family protein [Arenimonas sp.]HEU0152496.1 EcsC family protein [Arenimonas sp.]
MGALVRSLAPADLADLARAKALLESPSLAIQLANAVGSPVEYLLARKLPRAASALVDRAARRAVEAGYRAARFTLGNARSGTVASERLHQAAVVGSGAIGGFFGLPGLLLELPVTTTTILRSIADIARSEGESPQDPATRLACIEVLALGGNRRDDDGAETGYFATRAALAQQVSAVSGHLARQVASGSAPAAVRVIHTVAGRFSIPVSQKALAQAAPLVGAASGAALNLVFISHFQNAARGHFIVRRLERAYGLPLVRARYAELAVDGG